MRFHLVQARRRVFFDFRPIGACSPGYAMIRAPWGSSAPASTTQRGPIVTLSSRCGLGRLGGPSYSCIRFVQFCDAPRPLLDGGGAWIYARCATFLFLLWY